MGRKLPYKLQSGRPFTHFYSFFWLWSTGLYLGDSFHQTEQLPKSELPSHSSLSRTFQYFVPFSNNPPNLLQGWRTGTGRPRRCTATSATPATTSCWSWRLCTRRRRSSSGSSTSAGCWATRASTGAGGVKLSVLLHLLIFLLRNPVPIDKVSITEEGLDVRSV